MRIISCYKLKKNADKEEFKRYLKEKDIPAGNKIPHVISYLQTEVQEVVGLDIDCDFVEIWEVDTDKETWEKREWKNKSEFNWINELDKVAVSFVDVDSAKTFYLNDI